MQRFLNLYNRHREIVFYGIFGVLTTIVNWIAYSALFELWKGEAYANIAAVVISWIISVLFAYFTNRRWVFESKANGFDARFRECAAFFASRLFSGLADLAIMFAFVDLMRYDGKIIKLLSNILVIILNYLLSKFLVFKKSGIK